jgi:hypothetical protein
MDGLLCCPKSSKCLLREALSNLPWVDVDSVELNPLKQVRFTITDTSKYDEKKLVEALRASFTNIIILEQPK